MMQLISCRIEGLPGFASLELLDLSSVTALIGPNGAGKSSLLRALHLALAILSEATLCDEMPKHDAWERFVRGTLRFRRADAQPFQRFREHLGETFEELEVDIECDRGKFVLRRIRNGERSLEFTGTPETRAKLTQAEAAVAQVQTRLKDAQQAAKTVPPNQRAQAQGKVTELATSLEQHEQVLVRAQVVTASASGSQEPLTLDRADVDAFWSDCAFPMPVYIPPRQSPEIAIPALINELMNLKKGRKPAHSDYLGATARLSHLLQSDVDVSDVGGKESLHINGVNYKHASSGTETTLAFFALTRLGQPDALVLWDEPENGLHPTRRSRLLALMFADPRQYLLATHASEMAPVFSPHGRVFRCNSVYEESDAGVRLSVHAVAGRRDAFSALEALGVHPARTLFTANVAIWIEGPTELVFYRHWLGHRLTDHGLQEGFHYTYMQYGGALISYLEAADEGCVESTFDLLSLCRHPVILLDSDLRSDPGEHPPSSFLKPGAVRLLSQVEKLNSARPSAALLEWTAGRELENYLPARALLHAVRSVWRDASKYAAVLTEAACTVSQYGSFYEHFGSHLIAEEVTSVDKRDTSKSLPKGRTVWGPPNKVEMMRAALATPSLQESELRWDCVDHLSRLESFVVAKCSLE
ncbi:MAG: ATP-binding protein [Myxococcales bacterium]|nr:ATP-binding protein [Myxococcales bacterium]